MDSTILTYAEETYRTTMLAVRNGKNMGLYLPFCFLEEPVPRRSVPIFMWCSPVYTVQWWLDSSWEARKKRASVATGVWESIYTSIGRPPLSGMYSMLPTDSAINATLNRQFMEMFGHNLHVTPETFGPPHFVNHAVLVDNELGPFELPVYVDVEDSEDVVSIDFYGIRAPVLDVSSSSFIGYTEIMLEGEVCFGAILSFDGQEGGEVTLDGMPVDVWPNHEEERARVRSILARAYAAYRIMRSGPFTLVPFCTVPESQLYERLSWGPVSLAEDKQDNSM